MYVGLTLFCLAISRPAFSCPAFSQPRRVVDGRRACGSSTSQLRYKDGFIDNLWELTSSLPNGTIFDHLGAPFPMQKSGGNQTIKLNIHGGKTITDTMAL